jgi:hypothetical protein
MFVFIIFGSARGRRRAAATDAPAGASGHSLRAAATPANVRQKKDPEHA